MATKKSPEELGGIINLNRACHEVNGFAELLQRFERNISILGRSPRTFDNYSRHIAAMAFCTWLPANGTGRRPNQRLSLRTATTQ